jgi:hypothetical protein
VNEDDGLIEKDFFIIDFNLASLLEKKVAWLIK